MDVTGFSLPPRPAGGARVSRDISGKFLGFWMQKNTVSTHGRSNLESLVEHS